MTTKYSQTFGPYKGKNGSTGNYYFRASIEQNSQNIEANTSNVTVKLELYGESDSGTTMWSASAASNQPYGKITGTLAKTGNRIATYKKSTTPLAIVSYTADVQHNADGTMTISEVFSWVAGGLAYYPDSFTIATASNIALDTIPRASSITAENALITDDSGDLAYTITSAASFYHVLDMEFNGENSRLLNGRLINGTYTGSIAYSDLLTWLGSDSSATLELTLYTYSDSGLTNLVGTKTATATVANGIITPSTDFVKGSMYPRLFAADATNFNTNGITTLVDVIKCEVTEERNGAFELEMEVATSTPYFEQIQVGCLVVAKPNHSQGPQAFEIYEISKPISQRVKVRAHHISYRTSYIPVLPFTATGITDAIIGLNEHAEESNPFIITSDIANSTSAYSQTKPSSLRSRLGGSEGSLLDTFGGEYLWDNFNISLRKNRGGDNGVALRMGKNITDLTQTLNFQNVVTGALPLWSDGTTTVYGDVQHSASAGNYAYARTIILDLSDKFESEPTVGQLNQKANTYLQNSGYAVPNNNVKVSFIDLADTTEYKDSPLERVNLCDTVSVIYEALNVSYKSKVIKLKYDALADRTLEIEIGKPKQTLAQAINGVVSQPESSSGGGGGGGDTGKFYGEFVGDLLQTDSGGDEQVVVQQSGTDDIEVNAIGGDLKLGTSNTESVQIGASSGEVGLLGAFYKFLTTGFTGFIDGNASDANNLIPKSGNNTIAGDIGLYFTTSATSRTNWPTTTQRGFLLSMALTDNGTYTVQFAYMNAQNYLYMRVRNNGTWQAWRRATFSTFS